MKTPDLSPESFPESSWDELEPSVVRRVAPEALSETVHQECVAPVGRNAKVVIIVGDCRDILKCLIVLLAHFFAAFITSPPYFGLRNNGCGDQQIGLGKLALYRAALGEVFAYCYALLGRNGLFWLQMGDAWAGAGKGPPGKNAKIAKDTASRNVQGLSEITPPGFAKREMMQLPQINKELAQTAGFVLRNMVIWYKGQSYWTAKDRLENAYETILMLSKGAGAKWDLYKDALPQDLKESMCDTNVWLIPPSDNDAAREYGVDHSSTYPPQLPGACSVLSAKRGQWVLDPFGGLGTTALGALRFGINTVLIEQNPHYAFAAARQLLDLDDEFRPEVRVILPDLKYP